jgi:hypothetical protein
MGHFPRTREAFHLKAHDPRRMRWHVRCTSERYRRSTVSTPNHEPHVADLSGRHPRWPAALIATLLIVAPAAFASGQAAVSEPVRAFVNATRAYADTHRRLERQLGPIEITMSVERINSNIQQLATAIRAARHDAAQGDLFTAALAPELRVRIAEALAAHDFTAGDVLGEGRVEGIDYERVALRVNATFPWMLSVAMFPCVIEALPPLPPELQYRIVGSDLVLIDVHASLVVDILPAVIGAATER